MKRYGIIGGIAGGIVIVLAVIFFSIGQPFTNKSANSLGEEFNQAEEITPAELVEQHHYDTLHLQPKASVLIEDLRSSVVNVGVANRTETPLLTEVAENDGELTPEEELPEIVPWFYFSPNVALVSPRSEERRVGKACR